MNRILELEQEAIKKYIENIEWDLVIECLNYEEQLEYWKAILEEQPSSKVAKKRIKDLKKLILKVR